METPSQSISDRDPEVFLSGKLWYKYASTFKAEHVIQLDELTCKLSKVEVRVSAFLVKICQLTNISKAGLILEDIFS